MLYGLEYPFSGYQSFVSECTMIHFTCVEQSLKTYFGYYFGGFGDMDGYYSDNPPLLGTENIAGMIDAVHAQVAFAAQLAHKMHRTFIWPNTIDIMQKRHDEHDKIVLDHQERLSGIRAISWDSARKANIAAVEGNYLTNFKRVNDNGLETVYVDARASIPELEEKISKLLRTQVAILDFKHFSPPILQESWRVRKRDENEAPEEAQGENHESGEGQKQEWREEAKPEWREGENQEWIEGHTDPAPEPDPAAETVRWLQEREEEWFRDTFEQGGYRNFSQVFMDKLKKCPRADLPTECLGACGGG
jgi:hypothetical protein